MGAANRRAGQQVHEAIRPATSSVRQQVVYHAVGSGNIGNLNVAVIWVAGMLVLLQLLVFETPVGKCLDSSWCSQA